MSTAKILTTKETGGKFGENSHKHKVVREKELPLNNALHSLWLKILKSNRFTRPEIPNAKTAAEWDTALEDFKYGRNISGPFSTPKELKEYLDKV